MDEQLIKTNRQNFELISQCLIAWFNKELRRFLALFAHAEG